MLKRILEYAKPFRKTLIWVSFLILLMALLGQVEPFITRSITDSLVQSQGDGQGLFTYIGILLLVLLLVKLVQSGLNRLSWFLTNIFVIKFEAHLKSLSFDHLMNLSLSFFNQQESGKIISKLDRGVNRLISIINNSGMHFLPNVITAIISFAIVIYYEWRIGVITVLAFIPYIVINRWRFEKNSKLEHEEHQLYDRHYAHFYEVLSSMELIKAFRAEEFEKKNLRTFFKKAIRLRQEMENNTNRSMVGDILLELLSWFMYAYIVYITWQGQITIGTLILLVSLIQLIRQPLWQLNWIFWEVKKAQIGARDFFKIMDAKSDVVDPVKPLEIKDVKGEIVFDNVSFTYKQDAFNYFDKNYDEQTKNEQQDEERPKQIPRNLQVFKDVSFTIKPGEMTAFVGPSGAGKTTIASMLMRFFDPDQGKILLDGVDVKNFRQRDLRSQIGLVSQSVYLFSSSIEENLRYAKPNATEAEMWQACKIARADEFIEKLDKGLKTTIGERGVRLSGGQRQRLSLARTILRDPKIIILDEATSALDSESEMYIQQALTEVLKNRTSVVIAHRLSTVQRSDKIIVIKDQHLLEEGTHQQLLKKDGLYASLFKIQSGDLSKLKEWDLVG
ncbi:MAG: ABC transporter ATP-binding protein [Candidatus Pacebacteria bacterium]|nr:ABC transporter ATP-binding protein [Candidatus Paceibacterota bacterium]